jgi:hypothetical protein
LIVSSTGRCWKLHSATLKNASTVLRDLLDGREALRSIKRHKQDARSFRWKIHMVAWEEKPKETRLRTFKMVVSGYNFFFLSVVSIRWSIFKLY